MPTRIMLHRLLPLLPALLLGCAELPQAPDDADPRPESVAAPAASGAAQPAPERAFPEDSLEALMVAEFALRRRAYEPALEIYLEQAESLRDPGVSAHATHLAQFLRNDDAALAAARLWAELEPEHPEANSTLAAQLVRHGQPAAAVTHLARIARQGKSVNYPLLLGGIRQASVTEQADLASALAELSSEFPDDTDLLLTRALLLDELDRAGPAREVLNHLLTLAPNQQQALMLDAKLRLEAGEDAPFRRIEASLEADPSQSSLRLQYARLLTRNDLKAAREQFERLSAGSPQDADLLLSLALINQENGDLLAAKAYLRQVLALGERSDEAHYYLGRIAEEEGRPEDAIKAYRKVGDQESQEFFNARGRIGRILLENGDNAASARFFASQRLDYPEHREQLYTLESELLTRAGLMEESLSLLNQALNELPDSTSLRYSRSMLSEQMDDLGQMEADLRAILAREPDNATALNALGYTLTDRTDRHQEAFELIQRALELQPDEPAILDSMGWVLHHLGRSEEAEDYLRRAYTAMPDPEVAAHLGEVLWTLDREEEARGIWQAGLLQNAGHPVLRSTLRHFGIDPAELAL